MKLRLSEQDEKHQTKRDGGCRERSCSGLVVLTDDNDDDAEVV